VNANIKRRAFITLLGGAAAAWPLAARAQQPARVARIGYLLTPPLESPEGREAVNAFRRGLHEHGYTEGQNIFVEYRTAEGKIERFQALATELARLNLDVIVVANTPAALAAKQATTTIPIIVQVMGDRDREGRSPG
jgi:putative tryptophan/tyrosine transport system substrate-binding protein